MRCELILGRFVTAIAVLMLITACGGEGGGSLSTTKVRAVSHEIVPPEPDTIIIEGADSHVYPEIQNGATVSVSFEDIIWAYGSILNPSTENYQLRWFVNYPDGEVSDAAFTRGPCPYEPVDLCFDINNGAYAEFALYEFNNFDKGTFRYTLKAMDPQGNELGSASFVSRFLDEPPVVTIDYADESSRNPAVGERVSLTGVRSYDPRWSISAYEWVLVGKPDGSTSILENMGVGPRTSFVPDVAGDYTISLRIVDMGGQANSVQKVISVMSEKPTVSGSVIVEVHSDDIDNKIKSFDFVAYPYTVTSGDVMVIDEKVGHTVSFYGKVDGSGWQWRYQLDSQPPRSKTLFECSNGLPCPGLSADPRRDLFLDAGGVYVVSVSRQEGHITTTSAKIIVRASYPEEASHPNIGALAVYDNPDKCVSKEIAIPWVVDFGNPGDLHTFWSVTYAPPGTSTSDIEFSDDPDRPYGTDVTPTLSGSAEQNKSTKAIMLRAKRSGVYVVEAFVSNGKRAARANVLIDVSDSDLIDPNCSKDSDHDGINDYHDDTPFEPKDIKPAYVNGGSFGGSRSCTRLSNRPGCRASLTYYAKILLQYPGITF